MLDHLTSLVDKSLVLADLDEFGTTRYRFLETMHEFAGALLHEVGEEQELHLRHLAFFRLWFPACKQGLALEALRHTECEIYNLQLAVATAMGEQPPRKEDAAALVCLHAYIFLFSSPRELQLLDAILPQLDPRLRVPFPPVMAEYAMCAECSYYPLLTGPLKALGYFLLFSFRSLILNSMPEILAYAEQALTLYRQGAFPTGIAYTLAELATIVQQQEETTRATSYLEEACTLARTLPYQGFLLLFLWKQGVQALMVAEIGRARALFEEWYAGATQYARCTLGFMVARLEYLAGNYAHSRSYCETALQIFHNHPEERRILGDIAREEGRFTEAVQQYALSIAQWEPAGLKQPPERYCVTLESYAYLAQAQGKPALAARLLGCADRLREESGTPRLPYELHDYDRYWPRLCAALPAVESDALLLEGRELAPEDAITLGNFNNDRRKHGVGCLNISDH